MDNITQQEKLAYLAGLIDGEGYLGLLAAKKNGVVTNYKVRLCITNSSLEIMEWLVQNFGANYYAKTVKPENQNKHKVAYTWHINCGQAGRLIEAVRPYLLIKRKQADILAAYRLLQENSVRTCLKHFKFPLNLREEIHSIIKTLNHRGPVTTNTPDTRGLLVMIESELRSNSQRFGSDAESALRRMSNIVLSHN